MTFVCVYNEINVHFLDRHILLNHYNDLYSHVISELRMSGKSRYIWRKADFPYSLIGFT